MDHFHYRDGELFAEEVAVRRIAADLGTPAFIYSRATLEHHYRAFDQAFGDYPHEICYSVKANSNIAVLNVLAKLGSSFDVVSGGELARVIAAGGDPTRVVFSGVGKLEWELRSGLESSIRCFNVESFSELKHLAKVAESMGKVAPVAVRINPDVDAKTHPYISTGLKDNKFGVTLDRATELYQFAASNPHLGVLGVACHIGSQLTTTQPFEDALDRVLVFIKHLSDVGVEISHIDFGGGIGVKYKDEQPPLPKDYWQALHRRLLEHQIDLPISIEPGRAIAGNAGVFLTRIEYLKQAEAGNFCIVDGAMNDLIRPALYSAWQEIVPVQQQEAEQPQVYDVVGPICESADFLGKARSLAVAEGDLLAVRTAGAYGAVLSSNYNSRPRAVEVMVDGDQFHVIRQRERIEDLYQLEQVLPK